MNCQQDKMVPQAAEPFSKESHPWGDFLIARYRAILWMKDTMGYDDKRIAQELSMDQAQVYLIRMGRLSFNKSEEKNESVT